MILAIYKSLFDAEYYFLHTPDVNIALFTLVGLIGLVVIVVNR